MNGNRHHPMFKEKIYYPEKNDVLCGRGKFAMNWPGNLFHKDLIECHREHYFSADDLPKKRQLAVNIVDEIFSRSPPGRFLKLINDEWLEVDSEAAVRKTRQALREGAKFINNKDVNKRNKCVKNKHSIEETRKYQDELTRFKVDMQHKEFVPNVEKSARALSPLNSKEYDSK